MGIVVRDEKVLFDFPLLFSLQNVIDTGYLYDSLPNQMPDAIKEVGRLLLEEIMKRLTDVSIPDVDRGEFVAKKLSIEVKCKLVQDIRKFELEPIPGEKVVDIVKTTLKDLGKMHLEIGFDLKEKP